jgi:hypothetical protein
VRMRVESLTRQRQVLQTVWPVRIVRIDDSSCWVVVVGKPRRTSSSNSGIAKTSADLALVSVIIEAFVIERWYHMCYTVYIFFVSAISTCKFSTGLISKVMIYRGICQCRVTRKSDPPSFDLRLPDKCSRLEGPTPAHQASQHPFLASIQSPPLLENAIQRLIYLIVHKPFTLFIIYRSDSYASKPPLPNPRSRH